MNNYTLHLESTAELSVDRLLEIMAERTRVFVVEQNCPYQEVDQKDQTALHVYLTDHDKLVAYSRIIWHDDQVHISFGRVLVVKKYRGKQLGRQIVTAALQAIDDRFPQTDVKIQAQAHLQKFYGSFGFQAVSDPYLEDGIPHIDMVLIKNRAE